MRFFTKTMCLVVLCALITCATLPVLADTAATAKDILAKYSGAVIKVAVVIKVQSTYQGQAGEKQEMKNEATGTILDASGLTVVSLTEIDPENTWNSMGLGGSSDYQSHVETTDVKIRLANNEEIPAKIVLRDKDLDLAFIRPAQKLATPSPFIDLTSSVKLQPLDDMIILDRLGVATGRIPGVRIDRVQAVMEKPRTLYVPSAEAARSSAGAPVFSSDGKIVGLISLRVAPNAGKSRSPEDSMLYVTLPADDVMEIAKQAPQEAIVEKPAPAPPAEKPAQTTAPKPAPQPPAAKPKAPAKPKH